MSKKYTPTGIYDNALSRLQESLDDVRKRLRNQVSKQPEGSKRVNSTFEVFFRSISEEIALVWNIMLRSGNLRQTEVAYIVIALSETVNGSSLNEFWTFSLTHMSDYHFQKLLDDELYYTAPALFGNNLNSSKISTAMQSLEFYWREQERAIDTQRIRGYRDKGSLRLPHEFHSFVETGWNEVDYSRRIYNLQMVSLSLVEILIDEGSADELQDFVKIIKTLDKEEILDVEKYKNHISSIENRIERRTARITKE